jgi:hypothetical protein
MSRYVPGGAAPHPVAEIGEWGCIHRSAYPAWWAVFSTRWVNRSRSPEACRLSSSPTEIDRRLVTTSSNEVAGSATEVGSCDGSGTLLHDRGNPMLRLTTMLDELAQGPPRARVAPAHRPQRDAVSANCACGRSDGLTV